MAMLIGFNAMREFGERGISQYLGPTREIKLRLRFQVRQLDGDRHGLKVRQKTKKMKTGQIGRVAAIGGATGLLMLCVAIGLQAELRQPGLDPESLGPAGGGFGAAEETGKRFRIIPRDQRKRSGSNAGVRSGCSVADSGWSFITCRPVSVPMFLVQNVKLPKTYEPDYFLSGHFHQHPYLAGNCAVKTIGRTTLLVPGQLLSASHPSTITLDTETGEALWHTASREWIPETLNDRFVLKFE